MSDDTFTDFDRATVAERLDRALARRAEAEGLEASFTGREASFLRLAESRVIQASVVTEGRVTVRAVRGGAFGIAATSDLSDAGLDACAATAIARAEAAPASADAPALPAPAAETPAAPAGALDLPTATLSNADKATWLAGALAAHERDGLALAGRFHSGLQTAAVRSTTGVDVYHQGSFADLRLSALERPAGHRASASRDLYLADLRRGAVEAMAEEVRAECHRAKGPRSVPLGAWDVVLMPAAVAELMMWLTEIGFGSRAWEDGTTFMADRIGEAITGAQITLRDDGAMPLGLGVPSPFDAEGQPRRAIDLIEAGVARAVVHDTMSARRAGCAGTGHAQDAASLWAHGSRAAHLHLMPGEADLDALVGRLDRGLLITRFHYVNGMLDPRRAMMTGLLRDAAFLIEGGQIAHAVEPIRFTDSILEAFARIPEGGVGAAVEAHGGMASDDQVFVCPPLLVRGLKFTSGR